MTQRGAWNHLGGMARASEIIRFNLVDITLFMGLMIAAIMREGRRCVAG